MDDLQMTNDICTKIYEINFLVERLRNQGWKVEFDELDPLKVHFPKFSPPDYPREKIPVTPKIQEWIHSLIKIKPLSEAQIEELNETFTGFEGANND